MTAFAGSAEHYDRFMGRFAVKVAAALADYAGIAAGMRVLDVGCGPGALTTVLADRVGESGVAAIDPAPRFAAACRERHPGADVRSGAAESLPWPDDDFDAALACLVIGFMTDPDQGCREMARAVRPGGTVAACFWDLTDGGMTMLETFWDAVRSLQPGVEGERRLAGAAAGDTAARFERIGLTEVDGGALTVRVEYTGFDAFWEPFTYGIGPAGQYYAGLDDTRRAQVRDACRAALPAGAFGLDARAWCARGTVRQ